MAQIKKRYSLKVVFLVVLAVNILFTLLGLFVITVVEVPEGKDALKDIFTFKSLVKHVFGLLSQTLFFYFSLNYYNQLIVDRKPAFQYIGYTIFVLLAIFAYFWGMYYLFNEKAGRGKTTMGVLMFSFAMSSIFVTAATVLLAYLNNLRDEKKHRKVLEAQKMQLEVDKSHANFKFLKSQINPHFLHNTLNFLYAKSLPYSPELSEGILTLSDIMRYALNEATGSDDKAPLKDEIEHVRNVIKINQLRFSNNLNVHFEVKGIVNGLEIIPFLLITVVENAFKHGDLQRTEHPIVVRLTLDHNRLHFYCHNKKKTGPKEISTGLGLDNIRNRLDFAYGKNYKFDIKDDTEFYTTELTIYEL